MQSASPALMAWAASITALSPEPQTLLMVSAGNGGRKPGVDQGLPGGRLARAALHHLAHDDFFDRAGSIPARDTASRMTIAPSWGAVNEERPPR